MKHIRFIALALALLFIVWGCRHGQPETRTAPVKTVGPVSVASVGFTSRVVAPGLGGTGLDEVSKMPDAAFLVTNHTSARLTCQVTVDAFKPTSADSESATV